MKRYISIKIKQYLTIVLTSFLFPTLALLSLSSQTALAWGPERTTFNTENPAPFNTLNSIIDNPNYGDERNFFRVRNYNHKNWNPESTNGWTDTMNLAEGNTYEARIYIANDANTDLQINATNVKVAVNMPNSKTTFGYQFEVNAFIPSDNTHPTKIWDNIVLKSKYKFHTQIISQNGAADVFLETERKDFRMFSLEERERAVELYFTTPMTTAQVVEHLGYPTRQCLERWLAMDSRYAGHMAKPIIPLETRRRAVELVLGGMQQKQAAKQLGVSVGAVHGWVRAYRKGGMAALQPKNRNSAQGNKPAGSRRWPSAADDDDAEALRRRVEELELENALMREVVEVVCVLASWRPLCERCFSAV